MEIGYYVVFNYDKNISESQIEELLEIIWDCSEKRRTFNPKTEIKENNKTHNFCSGVTFSCYESASMFLNKINRLNYIKETMLEKIDNETFDDPPTIRLQKLIEKSAKSKPYTEKQEKR